MNFGQSGWRWCNKCEGMFFAGHETFGFCPAGDQHDPQGSGFYMIQQHGSNVPGQEHWRWCFKCEGLFFDGHSGKGVCPRDGSAHDGAESGAYILHAAGTLAKGQTRWRWCRNCEGLFFGGRVTHGVCEATAAGEHDPSESGDYMLRRAGEHVFDRDVFIQQYEQVFPDSVDAQKRVALAQLLTFAEEDQSVVDLRWIAYMLATARHEVGLNYLPIRESGCVDGRTPVCTPIPGNDRSYGEPRPCPNLSLVPPTPCPNGEVSHTYYGRGYVQITHQGNYGSVGLALGRGDSFVHDPDALLDPRNAYDAMSVGMREGLFTTRKLSDFINDQTLDYLNARKIVNPGDTKTFGPIAVSAERFETALELSLR